MKEFYEIIATKVNEKPYYQLQYSENGEIYLGYGSYDFEKVLKWKEENLDVKEIAVNENGKTTYEQGLADAWEAARKIAATPKNGGLSVEQIAEIFGSGIDHILNVCKPAEAIAKIKAYENKQQKIEQEIKVGDEVVEIGKEDDIAGIVTSIFSLFDNFNIYYILWADGSTDKMKNEELKKTGRHFPQIEKLLKAIKEGQ